MLLKGSQKALITYKALRAPSRALKRLLKELLSGTLISPLRAPKKVLKRLLKGPYKDLKGRIRTLIRPLKGTSGSILSGSSLSRTRALQGAS